MKKHPLCLGFLLLIAVLAYGEIPQYFFTDVDALSLINSGRYASLSDFWRVLTSELMAGRMVNAVYYRPVTSLTFGTLYHFFGLKPFGYHAMNLDLFSSTAVCIFLMARTLWGDKRGTKIGFLAALFFLLHPVQVDNVPAIARLGDVLAGFLAAASICFFLCAVLRSGIRHRLRWYVLALLTAIFAVGAKEPGAVATVTLGAIAFAFSTRASPREKFVRTAVKIAPFFLLLAAFIFVRQKIIGGSGGYVSEKGIFGDPQVLHVGFRFYSTILGHILGLLLPAMSDHYDTLALFVLAHQWMLAVFLGLLFALFFRPLRQMTRTVFQKAFSPNEPHEERDQRIIFVLLLFLMTNAFLLFFTIFTVRYLHLATIPFSLLLAFFVVRLLEERKNAGTALWGLRALAVAALIVVIFYDSPLWSKEKLRRWKTGGEIAKSVLLPLKKEAFQNPDERIYLLNVPYILMYGKTAPIFWEVPFNQILLQHAMEDYLDLVGGPSGEKHAEIVTLNYLYLTAEPKDLLVETVFTSPSEISVRALSGAVPSPFPWSRIPGRDPYLALYDLEGGRVNFAPEPAEGWDNWQRIHLKPEAFTKKPFRFLAYDGKTLSALFKSE